MDDRLANEWKTLYDLCSAVQPEQILVTSSGYSEQAENFVGVPMTLITQERVRFRFLR